MLQKSVTKEIIKEFGFDTWFSFYGNIFRSETREQGKTVYILRVSIGTDNTLETEVPKSVFKRMAIAELGFMLAEAGIKGFKALIKIIKDDKRFDDAIEYPLGYVRIDKKTDEVTYQVRLIPMQFINELAGENLDNFEKPFEMM